MLWDGFVSEANRAKVKARIYGNTHLDKHFFKGKWLLKMSTTLEISLKKLQNLGWPHRNKKMPIRLNKKLEPPEKQRKIRNKSHTGLSGTMTNMKIVLLLRNQHYFRKTKDRPKSEPKLKPELRYL